MYNNLNKGFESPYNNERLTHISNYEGIFNSGESYKKFDFVYHTGDGAFYYATEDISWGGGAESLQGNGRFVLDPTAPVYEGRESHYLYDSYVSPLSAGRLFEIGQKIQIDNSQEGNDGLYKVVAFDSVPNLPFIGDKNTVTGALEATNVEGSTFNSSWFLHANPQDPNGLDARKFAVFDNENRIFNFWLGNLWIHVTPDDSNNAIWLWSDSYLAWLWTSKQIMGDQGLGRASFVWNQPYELYKIKSDSEIKTKNFQDGDVININGLVYPYVEVVGAPNFHINEDEYDALPAEHMDRHYSRMGVDIYFAGKDDFESTAAESAFGPAGWLEFQRPHIRDFSYIVYNHTENQWYGSLKSQYKNLIKLNSLSRTVGSTPSISVPDRNTDGEVSRLQIQGVSESTKIVNAEQPDDYDITITAINESPDDGGAWIKDKFFFDADYGSTVNFKANNIRHDYDNGYYKVYPASTNSLEWSINLNFKNRTNREANAIIHFLENHQGQQEQDKNTAYLKYSQGISGFKWDGNAMFHPYDSLDNQSKTFYAERFNHSLNFEDSNDINVTLRNYNTSILNKSESLFVTRAETYNENDYYEYNDVAFSDINNRYYYWYSNTSAAGKEPVLEADSWSRASGIYVDQNKDYWTREFFWKPSLGLDIEQKPRMKEISFSSSNYKQIYNDGINESLLELNLSFNNRDDDEAYAILHFLEDHLGYMPFIFSPPSPYETPQNFICQQWSHTYNYKNNHSISAKFEQFPFNLDAEGYDNMATQPLIGDGQLIFTNPVNLSSKNEDARIDLSKPFRHRISFENIGGGDIENITMTEITTDQEADFEFIGQAASESMLIIPKNLQKSDYEYTLPSTPSLPFGLNNTKIRLIKNFQQSAEGGQSFYSLDVDDNVVERFFQKNNGDIKNVSTNSSYSSSNYFVSEEFLKANKTDTIGPGQRGYVEVAYSPDTLNFDSLLISGSSSSSSTQENIISYTDSSNNVQDGIKITQSNRYVQQLFEVTSTDVFSPQTGIFKIYIYNQL